MEPTEDEALESPGMPGYKVKGFPTEQGQEHDQHIYLPQFPRSFNLFSMFGKYANVIPEETEDAASPRSDNFSKIEQESSGTEKSISHKVQELGLTAQPNPEPNFEPFWVQIEPKKKGKAGGHHKSFKSPGKREIKKLDVRRSSLEDTRNTNQNVHSEGIESERNVGYKYFEKNYMHFDQMDLSTRSSVSSTALDTTNSVINMRGNIFRRSNESINDDNSHIRRGEIFRNNSGIQRSVSAGNIQKALNDEKKQGIVEGQEIVPLENTTQIIESGAGLRRSSSTGNLQRLQTSTLRQKQEKSLEAYNLENPVEVKKDDQEPMDKQESKTAKGFGKKLQSLGKETLNWATTSKVQQTKKERHYFSPTSF